MSLIIKKIELQIIENVDLQLESLTKKEKRKLFILISEIYAHDKSDIDYVISRDPKTLVTSKYKLIHNKVMMIISLYNKVNISDFERYNHWKYYHYKLFKSREKYDKMAKLPRQDNKTYINSGQHNSNANKIRFPRKCRKTAWKRFYKLFPHLKPITE